MTFLVGGVRQGIFDPLTYAALLSDAVGLFMYSLNFVRGKGFYCAWSPFYDYYWDMACFTMVLMATQIFLFPVLEPLFGFQGFEEAGGANEL